MSFRTSSAVGVVEHSIEEQTLNHTRSAVLRFFAEGAEIGHLEILPCLEPQEGYAQVAVSKGYGPIFCVFVMRTHVVWRNKVGRLVC